MSVLVENRGSHGRAGLVSLLTGHSENSGEDGHSVGVVSLLRDHQRQSSDLLEGRVLSPGSQGLLGGAGLDINEAGTLKVVAEEVDGDTSGASHLLKTLLEEDQELAQSIVLGKGVVVGVGGGLDLSQLDPSTGLQASPGLSKDGVPRLNTLGQVTDVDEVEGVGLESPLALSIVDLEATVGGNPVGLDGRQVDSDDLSRGVGVGHV